MSGSKIPTKVKTSSRGLLWLVVSRNRYGFFGISLSWGVFCYPIYKPKPTKPMYFFILVALAIQTLILLFNRFVYKIKYSPRIIFYFYIKSYLLITIPLIIMIYSIGQSPQGLSTFWGLGLIIYIFERFNNKKEIQKYKKGVSKEDFEEKE